jgi:hypothetical protein
MTAAGRALSEELLDAAVELLGRHGGPRRIRTREDTGSMQPTLAPGAEIRVDLSCTRPRIGDVFVFRQGSQLVVHRFLARVPSPRIGRCLRFRGDYGPGFDPPVRDHQLRGRVVALQRDGSWWSLDGPGARVYAAAMAQHSHFWGGLIGFVDRVGQQGGGEVRESPLARGLIRLDRTLFRWVDRWLFRALHRPADPGER